MHNYLIISLIVSLGIIISKFLDCWTTSFQITNINHEQNPLARKLMRRFGIQRTIWTTFVFTVILVILINLAIFCLHIYNTLYFILYITIGAILSITQFAVVYTNITHRKNLFTRFLDRIYKNRR